ncbi:unnamed protein product [Diatraea saccharalis]|uniref:Uncharacterized protein n=1 Tax=Diatraea saccharalis TaxID=40085 RepID=A0A9N9QUW7_9NEOP|nr:unnamed protein product [Diatraea saccharalis]
MENQNRESEKTVSDSVAESLNHRKRTHSLSSSSSSDDSDSANRDSSPRNKARKYSATVSNAQFEILSQQVSLLTNLITASLENKDCQLNIEDTNVTTNEFRLHRPELDNSNTLNILSDVGTTVKDPIYTKSNESFVNKLVELQRFNYADWYAVRFADAQKKYLSTPGFIELSVNDELKRYESAMLKEDSRSYLLERSFASLTNALLSQKELLHKSLHMVVDWAYDSKETLTPSSLFDKIQTTFSKESAYSKVTDDLLQIICGRRTDLITNRRDSLLRQIPESYHRDVLYKIPPSSVSLFNEEKLSFVSKPTHKAKSNKNFYDNQRPSTSKQTDDTFFRQDYSSKRGKRAPRPANQQTGKPTNKTRQQQLKKRHGRSSFKGKHHE